MISDHKLRQDVLDELEFEPSINAAHIGVGVNRGVVTLTGFVPSYAEKKAVERAVLRVKGVKAMAEEIEVRLPEDKKTADEEIAGRAVDILKWRVGLPADRIAIKVEKGMVTLTGELDWHYEKAEAAAAVQHLTGVIGVINDIRVRANAVKLPEVKDKIERALLRSAELDASRITVRIDGAKVVLGGKVHAWFERDLAERAAWAVPGVTEVRDEIQIEP
jgi:osmotically-inducible protein OsmY